MLYEPPKTKKYILIGAAAIVLAVLTVVIFSIFHKNKKSQTPSNNILSREKLQQQKIQKEFEKLNAMRKNTSAKEPTPEEIQKGFAELEKQRKESNAIPPTPEQIRAEFEKLEQMRK